jgi:hypothetical protein
MEVKTQIAVDHRLLEDKGRGIAVFCCASDDLPASLHFLPGTIVCTPEEPYLKITPDTGDLST